MLRTEEGLLLRLVDDQPQQYQLSAEAIRVAGYRIARACEPIDLLREDTWIGIDAAILDIDLGRWSIDGLDLLHWLERIDLPLIVVSDTSSPFNIGSMSIDGTTYPCLPKPLDPMALRWLLREIRGGP